MAVNNTNVRRSACSDRYLRRIVSELGLSLDRFSKKVPNIKFRPVKVELIHADTGTGGHDDMATMRTRLDIGVGWLITLGGRQEGGRNKIDYRYEEL